MPGLNNLYYRYLAKKIMDNPPDKDDIDRLDNAYRRANIRMIVIFLIYLIPIFTTLYFAINNLMIGYCLTIAFEIAFIAFNFIFDNKYQRKLVN